MSAAPGSLAFILPVLAKIFQGPGKLVLIGHGFFAGLLTFFAARAINDGHSSAWFFVVLGVIFVSAIIVFALRGSKLVRLVNQTGRQHSSTFTVSQDVTVHDGETPEETEWQGLVRRLDEARFEADIKTAKYMPRVEAAQRAAIAASGGIGNAPYLKADLRPTLVSGLVSIIAGPISFFSLILVALLY